MLSSHLNHKPVQGVTTGITDISNNVKTDSPPHTTTHTYELCYLDTPNEPTSVAHIFRVIFLMKMSQ